MKNEDVFVEIQTIHHDGSRTVDRRRTTFRSMFQDVTAIATEMFYDQLPLEHGPAGRPRYRISTTAWYENDFGEPVNIGVLRYDRGRVIAKEGIYHTRKEN